MMRGSNIVCARALLAVALACAAGPSRIPAQSATHQIQVQPDPVYTLLTRAYQLLRGKEYEAAVEQFRRALEMNPDRAEIHLEIGYALLKMGETEAAVEPFEAYLARKPKDCRVRLELGYLYHQTRRHTAALDCFRLVSNCGDARLAGEGHAEYLRLEAEIRAEIERWQAAVDGDPSNDGNRELLAEAFARHGDFVPAIRQYLANRKLKRARYADLLRLAELYEATGARQAAHGWYVLASRAPDVRVAEKAREAAGNRAPSAEDLENALALEAEWPDLQREVGYFHVRHGAPERAAVRFEAAVASEPGDFQSLAQLGFLYAGLGRREQALSRFERVRVEGPADLAARAEAAIATLGGARELALMAKRLGLGSAPAYELMAQAEEHSRRSEHEQALGSLRAALEKDKTRVGLHREIGSVLLRMGEVEAAVQAFEAYEQARPGDPHNQLQLAHLYLQTGREAKALGFFRRVERSSSGDLAAVAREQRVAAERPLLAEIQRLTAAMEQDPANADNRELMAEALARHGDIEEAIAHYIELRRRVPERARHLPALARLYEARGDEKTAEAWWLLAWRASDPRVSEAGRAGLGNRYPAAGIFERALESEPDQHELRREVAYFYVAHGLPRAATEHFERIAESQPTDFQSATQLGLLYADQGRRDKAAGVLERVRSDGPPELAEKARGALAQLNGGSLQESLQEQIERHRRLAYASLRKDYLAAAANEFEAIYKLDPRDYAAVLQLGWLYNIMKKDDEAIRWFRLARSSPDAKVAAEAKQAYTNLTWPLRRVITTIWMQPFITSRFDLAAGYGQMKTEYRPRSFPVRPYVGMRFVGDTRSTTAGAVPEVYSEDGVIFSVGAVARVYRELHAWGEAGNLVSFLGNRPQGLQRSEPDYRGGLNYGKVWGARLFGKQPGVFFDLATDAVYLSRYGHNAIFYAQTKTGYQLPPYGAYRHQPFVAFNTVADARGDYYHNFAEVGGGYRFGLVNFSRMNAYVALVRGSYTSQGRRVVNYGRAPNYWDFRVVIWYAKSF